MSSTSFYEGSVVEAIHKSRVERKPLVVFLKGPDEESDKMEKSLSCAGSTLLEGCFVLRLEDDPTDGDNPLYKNAKMFKQYFPTEEVPAVLMVGPRGPAICSFSGQVDEHALLEGLEAGRAEYDAQVKRIEEKNALDACVASTPLGTIHRLPPREKCSAVQPGPSMASIKHKKPSNDGGPNESNDGDVDEEQAFLSSSMDNPATSAENPKAKSPPDQRKNAVEDVPVYDTTKLQFRLTNGELLRADFASDATVKEVYGYLDIHRTDGWVPFTLETLYPKITCGVELYGKTLKEMDWVPRSTVILKELDPGKGACPQQAEAQSPGVGMIAGGLVKGVGRALASVNPFGYFWTGSARTHPTSEQGEPDQDVSYSETQHAEDRKSGVRRRSNFGSNVHGLHDSAAKSEDDSNTFW